MWNPDRGQGSSPTSSHRAGGPVAAAAGGPPQLVLADAPRDLSAGMRNGFPPPPDPAVEAAFGRFAGEYAVERGWRRTKTERTRRAVRIMLGTTTVNRLARPRENHPGAR